MTWTFTFLLVLGITAYGVSADSFLTPLANHVKSHCDPDVAPMQDHDHAVQVNLLYGIMNVADVDEEHNTVTSEAMVTAIWHTDITWNPADYGGVDMITLPQKYFWTPHMQPISTAVGMVDLSPHLVVVFSNGTATHSGMYRMTALCDVTEIHTGATCEARSSLWGYSKDQVTIAYVGAYPTSAIPYFAGSKYEVLGASVNKVDLPFDGKTYQILASTFTIREKPGQHRRGPFRAFFQWH